MSVDASPHTPALVERVKNILLKPKAEWDRIAAEPATIQGLYTGYICILAAIGPICLLIGTELFGRSYGMFGFGVTIRPSLVGAVTEAVTSYVGALVGVFLMALVIEFLAPSFGGTKDRLQALKTAAYSATPGWVAGVLFLLPSLSGLVMLASLYGLYLLYLGLPKTMRAPQDKAPVYTVVTLVAAFVLFVIVGALIGAVRGLTGTAGGMVGLDAPGARISGRVTVPGGGSIDMNRMQQAANSLAAAGATNAQTGGAGAPAAIVAVSTDVLGAMLPGAVSGYARGAVATQSHNTGGVSGSSVEAPYVKGPASFTLRVTDLASVAGLAQMAGAVEVSHTTNNGGSWEKIGRVDGRTTTEKFDGQTRHGEYMVLVGDRFSVEATGEGVDMADLKAAVHAVPFGRLEALSKH